MLLYKNNIIIFDKKVCAIIFGIRNSWKKCCDAVTPNTNESFHTVKHYRSSTSAAESGSYKKVIALNVAECVLK